MVRCFFRWGRSWEPGDQGGQDIFDSSETGFDVRIVAESRDDVSADLATSLTSLAHDVTHMVGSSTPLMNGRQRLGTFLAIHCPQGWQKRRRRDQSFGESRRSLTERSWLTSFRSH
jgi:hypothetical protein